MLPCCAPILSGIHYTAGFLWRHSMRWPVAANLSLLFADLPLPERAEAARDAGFSGVEIQFP